MLMLITNKFKVRDRNGIATGRWEELIDYAVDLDTGRSVIMPSEPPWLVGAKFDKEIGEWMIYD